MNLKATNKVETNRYELEIVIDSAEFAEAIDKAYRKNVEKINIPGFRKGKAPKAIVEKMYGVEFFYEDALNILYPDAVDMAIKESGLEVVSDNIGFELVSISKEDGADFKITVVVKPEVELKQYKGLKAEKTAVSVTDEEIDEQVEQVAQRNSRMISVEDRAAQNDDTVVIDFEGFVDGVAFDGGKAEAFSLKLGSGQFIPGFEDQVIGHSIDDEFDVNVTFPEDYGAENLAGKPAVFKIKLHEIKMTELPTIDDEFAKDVSEFDTLAEYKADLKAKALESKQKSADDAVENQLIDQLVENLVAEIPSEMVDSRVDDNIRDFAYRLQMQGMDLETYVKYTGGDINALRDSFREQSEKQVKVRLALEKIAEIEKLDPTDDEIEAEFAKYADNYKMDVEKIKQSIPVSELSKDLAVSKAISFVRDNAEITEAKAAKKSTAKKADDTAKAEKKPAAKKTAAKKPAAKKPETEKAE